MTTYMLRTTDTWTDWRTGLEVHDFIGRDGLNRPLSLQPFGMGYTFTSLREAMETATTFDRDHGTETEAVEVSRAADGSWTITRVDAGEASDALRGF